MPKADLHVHSRYSSTPADLVLKKFGTPESYTELEEVYRSAKARGMDFVTVTDHNTASGTFKLAEMCPQEAFTGVELTTCFPEDGCAVHLLVYDFTPAQFAELDRLRGDIYQLRNYIKAQGLPYSVAHATYSVNGRLSIEVIEKLILLFDVFECINGTRVQSYNDLLKKVLQSLTLEKIEELHRTHRIEPISDTPWIKAFTGGSDEHAGLFIGATYTTGEGVTKQDFLAALREKRTDCGGRSNHYKTQVYTFLRIAYQYSRTKRGSSVKRAWDELCGAIFDGKPLSWKTQLKIQQLKRGRKSNTRVIASQVGALVRRLVHDPSLSHEQKIDLIYETVAGLEDEFFVANLESFRESFAKGDILKIMSSITAVVRSFFLSLPFLGTFRHLHQSSAIMEKVQARFLGPLKPEERRVLWFSDTVNDLNGVSITLRNFASFAGRQGLSIRLVSARQQGEPRPDYQLELPTVYEYTPDFYPNYTMRFPSLLKSLELICAERPTEIIVSTPGPVGLLGVLAARLFGIPCRGIYHSDFSRMAGLGLSGGTMASFVEGFVRWFYSCVDEVGVPTQEIIRRLIVSGYESSRLTLFKRGIDTTAFAPVHGEKNDLRRCYGLDDRMTLLYAGRVSRDKSLGLLVQVYRELIRRGEEINLLIAGDGPMLEELKKDLSDRPRVRFTGRLAQRDLPLVYSMADLFVFPSTIDTFGMAVLEAQACELPVLVTNVGGPQEVILAGTTGFVLPANDLQAWVDGILKVKAMMKDAPKKYQAMRQAARARVQEIYPWEGALADLFAVREKPATKI
ncbi:MAG: glycosyltransferase [Candidatus Omnitrophica bacterium]|nr:glycosyltransferase [Candidatus Omnitrophota bacterium]